MSFMNSGIVLDGPAAAVIAAGMRAVAKADGELRPEELKLIEAFEAGIGESDVPDPKLFLGRADLAEAYVRSLVMVALADGEITESEQRVIVQLSGALDVDETEVARITLDVKRWFLSTFSGVVVFRDSVKQIADDLGVEMPSPASNT